MSSPTTRPQNAVASQNVRILAFLSICVGGLLGGLIGWSFVRLQIKGNAETWAALGALGGSILSALGIAVVATLVMRAMREWNTIQRGVNPRTGEPIRPRG